MIYLIIIAILLIVVLHLFSLPKVGNVILITGGVKTGKSTLSVHTAFRLYRKQRIKWYIKCLLSKLFRRPKPEEPLIYSNIPLRHKKYCPMTTDILERITRPRYGSILYLCESSLVADSMLFKDKNLNDRLLLFNKLIGHETKGGYLIYDTQSVLDNHYAVKRCINSFLNIEKKIRLPFFLILKVSLMKFNDVGVAPETYIDDNGNVIAKPPRTVIVPTMVWRRFDCYCYSIMTDSNKVYDSVEPHVKSLKAEHIITFKGRYSDNEKH